MTQRFGTDVSNMKMFYIFGRLDFWKWFCLRGFYSETIFDFHIRQDGNYCLIRGLILVCFTEIIIKEDGVKDV